MVWPAHIIAFASQISAGIVLFANASFGFDCVSSRFVYLFIGRRNSNSFFFFAAKLNENSIRNEAKVGFSSVQLELWRCLHVMIIISARSSFIQNKFYSTDRNFLFLLFGFIDVLSMHKNICDFAHYLFVCLHNNNYNL